MRRNKIPILKAVTCEVKSSCLPSFLLRLREREINSVVVKLNTCKTLRKMHFSHDQRKFGCFAAVERKFDLTMVWRGKSAGGCKQVLDKKTGTRQCIRAVCWHSLYPPRCIDALFWGHCNFRLGFVMCQTSQHTRDLWLRSLKTPGLSISFGTLSACRSFKAKDYWTISQRFHRTSFCSCLHPRGLFYFVKRNETKRNETKRDE